MGVILEAECTCGFTCEEMAIGGGAAHDERYCGLPALCSLCGAFEVHNRVAAEPKCTRCRSSVVFYDDPSLQGPAAVGAPSLFIREGCCSLPDVLFHCPRCRSPELVFRAVGEWQ